MSRFRLVTASVLAIAGLAMVIPGVVSAAPSKPQPLSHVFGSLESINPNVAFIHTLRGNIKVVLDPVVAYVTYDQADALAGVKVGDSVEADGIFIDGTLHAQRLRYASAPFAVTRLIKFNGHYSSSTTTTLTLVLESKRHPLMTFNVDANTKYYLNGHRLSGPPSYEPKEHIIVWAREYSDQSWLAAVVSIKDPNRSS